jgi:hypothetical protein
MTRKPRTVELTPLQIAQTLVALRAHIAALDKQEDEDPQGDEVQDILVAQSVVKILAKAGADADREDYPCTQQPLIRPVPGHLTGTSVPYRQRSAQSIGRRESYFPAAATPSAVFVAVFLRCLPSISRHPIDQRLQRLPLGKHGCAHWALAVVAENRGWRVDRAILSEES